MGAIVTVGRAKKHRYFGGDFENKNNLLELFIYFGRRCLASMMDDYTLACRLRIYLSSTRQRQEKNGGGNNGLRA